jgi:hypothetical protein
MKADALLVTTTSEPYQPVRLYYSIPSRAFVLGRIGKLRCMQPSGRGLDWYYRDEVDSLEIGFKRIRPPPEAGDVLLAQIRFPKTGMTIQVRSFSRAVVCAKYIKPILGDQVVLARGRVVNRWFTASENEQGLDVLDKHLDQNVTIIDVEKNLQRMEARLAEGPPIKTMADLEARAAEGLRRRIASREDVPLVEDFPFDPVENADLRDLEVMLRLRAVRCAQRWMGKDVTLTEVIVEMVEQAKLAQAGPCQGTGRPR